MRALILGGTKEARETAKLLQERGWHVTSSLAGRVANPALPVGEVRIGGFGGPAGLARWLITSGVEVIIDATHPYAEKISLSASEASRATGIPLIGLHRKPWQAQPKDRWREVDSVEDAAALVARDYHHIFLSIGRQHLAPFANDPHNLYVIRAVDPPKVALPPRNRVILSRGPFSLDSEKKLMVDNQIDVVVSKNSGGEMTYAKIEAARMLGIDVVLIRRPSLAPVTVEVHSPQAVLGVVEKL